MQPGSPGFLFPFFTSPQSLNFYLGDQTTHKQVLTIYNVYDMVVRFKVFSTVPNKYGVVAPEGTIRPRRSVDIVIRHRELWPANCNVEDKFQVQLLEHSTRKLLGKVEITATLHSGTPVKAETVKDDPSQFPSSAHTYPASNQDIIARSGPNKFLVFLAILCLAGLLWPSEEQPTNFWVDLFRKIKILCAYVLGLTTVAILQP